jgi:hypothetical protein
MGDITVTAAKVAAVYPEQSEIYDGIAGATITAGQILYKITASGKLGLADEDADAEHSQGVGVALNGGGSGQAISYLKKGPVEGFSLSGLAYNLPCSLSTTAGALLDTGATTNVVARVMSTSEVQADGTLGKVLYFDFPVGTYATVAT